MKKKFLFIASFLSFFSIGERLKISNVISLPPAAIIFHSPKTNAETISSIITRGIMAAKSGNYSQAIKLYNKALEMDPENDLAYFNRGLAKIKLKDYLGAISDFDKAIEINPQYAEAYLNRASLKGNMDDYRGAISDYDKALEINPQYTDAYIGRAIVRILIGGVRAEACLDIEKAISLGGSASDLHEEYCSETTGTAGYYYFRANRKSNEGDYSGALADFNEAIEISPDYVVAYLGRAYLKRILKDYEGAIDDYTISIDLSASIWVDAFLNRGIAKFELGKYNEALEDFNKSLEEKPGYLFALLWRGYTLLVLGKNEIGCNDFKEIILTFESEQYLTSMHPELQNQANDIFKQNCN